MRRRGGEGPGGCLRRTGEFWGGGGLNIFFRGRNVHQVLFDPLKQIFFISPKRAQKGQNAVCSFEAGPKRRQQIGRKTAFVHIFALSVGVWVSR